MAEESGVFAVLFRYNIMMSSHNQIQIKLLSIINYVNLTLDLNFKPCVYIAYVAIKIHIRIF